MNTKPLTQQEIEEYVEKVVNSVKRDILTDVNGEDVTMKELKEIIDNVFLLRRSIW